MLQDLNIPRMGSVENARMVAWRIGEGEAFAAGDVLYEIETDKTTTEVEADHAGILARRLASDGDEFKVGDRIGLWVLPGTRNAQTEAALAALDGKSTPVSITDAKALAPPAPAAAIATRPIPRSAAGGVRISPLARRLAALHGVDVAGIIGSGNGGRITGNDVLAAARAPAPPRPPLPIPTLFTGTANEATKVPHSMRRQTIARRMTQAAAIPSLTADMEIDLTALLEHRKREGGTSVLGLIAHQAVATLMAHPRLNAHWGEDAMVQWHTVHLGIAVDAPEGLVVPVIRHAERLSARGIAEAISGLAEKARTGTLRAEELEAGTFTISNPGSLGPVIRAEALLNPPQVALLGLPGMVRAVKAVPDGEGWAMAVRPVIRPSLTFDHRALDGGPVIAFLNELKSRIEAL